MVTSVSAWLLKNLPNAAKNEISSEFSKFSERVWVLPNASRSIQTYPNASEQVQAGPSTFENLPKLVETCKSLQNFATFCVFC